MAMRTITGRPSCTERPPFLQRGESVSGGLGKKLDIVAVMKAAGITPGDLRRMRLYGSLTKTEFESLLEPTRMKRRLEAADRVFDREVRRIIRARPIDG
jgi:hypothetical protein